MKIIEEIVIVHVTDHIGGGFIGDVRPEKVAVAVNLKRVRIAHGVKLLSVFGDDFADYKMIFKFDIVAAGIINGELGDDTTVVFMNLEIIMLILIVVFDLGYQGVFVGNGLIFGRKEFERFLNIIVVIFAKVQEIPQFIHMGKLLSVSANIVEQKIEGFIFRQNI
jgi:hypothetical protein